MAQGLRISFQIDSWQLLAESIKESQDWRIQQMRATILEAVDKSLRGQARNYAPNRLSAGAILESLGEQVHAKPMLISSSTAAAILERLQKDLSAVNENEINQLVKHLEDDGSMTEEIMALVENWQLKQMGLD